MGRAGLNRKTALATATVTLAAEAPDLDILAYFRNPVFGFAHHRGFTHSFVGVPLMGAVVLGVVYLVWVARGRKIKNPELPPRWGLLFLYTCLAGVSHILLDYTNNYGVRPFWPYSEKWYSWDIVFIVDPILLGILILGLVLPGFFGLINEEIGARSKGPQGRVAATLALIGVVLLWGVRDYEHRRAVNELAVRSYQAANPLRLSAYPSLANPLQWTGVVETRNFFAVAPVDASHPELDPQDSMRLFYKPEETPVTVAAKRSYLGRVYLDWAQYPITETQRTDRGYVVYFRDLRYEDLAGRRSPLAASVELDSNLNVVAERMGMRGRPKSK